MNETDITVDSLHRLAKAIMLKHAVGYTEALAILNTFRLNLICNEQVARSSALQAALLTAVNAGKRAFHGGVFVSMPREMPCLLNWPGTKTLNEIVRSLGGDFVGLSHSPFTQTLYFGGVSDPVEHGLAVVCSGWRGGVAPVELACELPPSHDFGLGGIAAGALGVTRGFLRVSGLSIRPVEISQGISLWRPDLQWTTAGAEGPELEFLPNKLWILGLGHLGQAYLWSLGLLPYSRPDETHFLLQDFDRAVKGNQASGLLCEGHNVGKRKARICADWLEQRGFQTTITERAFDSHTKRTGEEPFVACCGFDSAEPRRILETAGFDLVVECALGSDTARFDRIILHTFPEASRKPEEIWESVPDLPLEPNIVEAFKRDGDCGIIAETLARKSVASSFVGAFAGTLVIGEILRALHGGVRCELVQMHLRYNERVGVILKPENYLSRIARNGYSTIKDYKFREKAT